MKAIDFKLVPHGSDAWKEAVSLREKVLRTPLGEIFTPEELREERHHIHVAGYLQDELVATAVLIPEGDLLKMQRVAVREDLRSKAIGSEMMAFCEAWARSYGYRQVYCHARETAVNFYRKNNYVTEGEHFNEDEIPHVKMKKSML